MPAASATHSGAVSNAVPLALRRPETVPAEIRLVPCLSDNYAVLIHDPVTEATAVVDVPEATPVIAALEKEGWNLTHILVTHHHADHTQGIPAVKARFGATVVGPKSEADKIPGLDVTVVDGDPVAVGSLVRALPEDLQVYSGHEYTLANARFAATVDPDNPALIRLYGDAQRKRDAGSPTIPSRLGDEVAANPFLRADDPGMAERLGMAGAEPALVFTELRLRKNAFKG